MRSFSDTRNDGYPTKTSSLKLALLIIGSITFGSFTLAGQVEDDEDIVTLEKFEIYGSTAAASVAKKRNSDIIGSFLSSDALSELPDDDLGEALSRLAGINVIGGQGNSEAIVTIRGAAGQYNTIRINGAAPSNARVGDLGGSNRQNFVSREFDLNQIPAEMVSAVEVIKSITAEYPGDSIGGAVNVETANAFDLGRRITRYKLESRQRDQGDLGGWGANIVHSDILDVLGGEDNFGMLFNLNYVDQELVGWSTQNRYFDESNRFAGPGDEEDSFLQQVNLAENPDASITIWDRFDPNEVRTDKSQLTFNASFDYILSDRTSLYFRPWYQKIEDDRDAMAVRLDRGERAFRGNYWFMDDTGNPLGVWEDSDGDGVLGSEDDTFIREKDASGNLVVTPNWEASGDGRIQRIVQGFNIDRSTYNLDFGGETILDNGLLEYRLYYSNDNIHHNRREWRFQRQDRDFGKFIRIQVSDGSTPLPEFSMFEITERRGHVPTNNKENIFASGAIGSDGSPRFRYRDLTEEIFLASVDYENETTDNLTLKTGARLRSATRDNATTHLFFAPGETNNGVFRPITRLTNTLDDIIGSSPTSKFTLWDGRYADDFGPFVTADQLWNHFFTDYAANPDQWGFTQSHIYDTADTSLLKEDVLAGYAQGTFRWDNLTLVAGGRIEHTSLDTTWKPSNFIVDGSNIPGLNDSQRNVLRTLVDQGLQGIGITNTDGPFNFGQILDDINETNSYSNFLPSAVLTYRAGDSGHVFRFAWTNTLTRPDYRDLVPFDFALARQKFGDAGVTNYTATGRQDDFYVGTPDLREQTAQNYDLAWEYYFGQSQRNTISFTLFKKSLKDFLAPYTYTQEVEVLVDPNDPSLGYETSTGTNEFVSNTSSRNLEGFEITGYFHFQDLFPYLTFLHDFSLIPNYARITGNQTDPIYDVDELANGNFVLIGENYIDSLTNQAEEVYNLQLIWERGRFNSRISYNYISQLQLDQSTAAITNLTYGPAQENVNLSVQYRLFANNDFRIFFEGNNLTDEPDDERFIGSVPGLFMTSYSTIGRRYVFGIRGSF